MENNGIKVETSNGFKVVYRFREFRAIGEAGEDIAHAATMDELDKKTAKIAANTRKVDNFPIIKVWSDNTASGKITSYDENEREYWVTNENGSRGKDSFTASYLRCYLPTPANKILTESIAAKKAEIARLTAEIEAQCKQFEQPVTLEMLKGYNKGKVK